MNKKEIDSLQTRTFMLDFPIMQLKQEGVSNPIIYSGPGSVIQTSNGELQFKLYHCGRVDLSATFLDLKIELGGTVPDDQFFSLKATDSMAREWTSKRIMPSKAECASGSAIIVTGTLPSLQNTKTTLGEFQSAYLKLRFPKGAQIPYNTRSSTVTTVNGERLLEDSNVNAANFSAGGFDFTLWDDDHWLLVEVQSNDKELPSYFDIRVCESLQFVLSKTLQWSVLEKETNNTITTIIRPHNLHEFESRKLPPLQYSRIADKGEVWKLFEKYLVHILPLNENRLHHLSGYIRAAIAASSDSLETEALITSVKIEGILREEFRDISAPKEKDRKEIDTANDLIEKSNLDPRIKRRIGGAIGAMKRARPDDKLRMMVEKGLIDDKLFQAWDKIRNSSAHGFGFNIEDIEKHSQQNHSVSLLFNLLIFLSIDYTGVYTDYSSICWPIKTYDCSKALLYAEDSKNEKL